MKYALVKMPFGIIYTGSLALGILQESVIESGIDCDVYYINLLFAKYIKKDIYEYLNRNWYLGEYIFSSLVYEDTMEQYKFNVKKYMNYIDCEDNDRIYRELINIRECIIPKFLGEICELIDFNNYDAIGFTCTMGELFSDLWLSKIIKKELPSISIIIGGPNVYDVVGHAVLKEYNWIDYIINGEGEIATSDLLHGLCNNEIPKGVSYRRGNQLYLDSNLAESIDISHIPYPNYDSYYNAIEQYNLTYICGKSLLVETSRGCWWGQKKPCNFCSSNTFFNIYRKKDPDRIIDELEYLYEKYRVSDIYFADTDMSNDFFYELFPNIIQKKMKFRFFFQVRPNITYENLKLMKDTGINHIRVGIESLDNTILRLLNKCSSALMNVQFLKFCKELDIYVDWNYLYRVPGESQSLYYKQMNMFPKIYYLQPPKWVDKIEMQRNSNYFKQPKQYGIHSIEPGVINDILFHGSEHTYDLSFTFSYHFDHDNSEQYSDQLIQDINKWKYAYENKLCRLEYWMNQNIVTVEREVYGNKSTYILDEFESQIFLFCTKIRSKKQIINKFPSQAEDVLNRLILLDVMLEDQGIYLSLPIFKGGYSSNS